MTDDFFYVTLSNLNYTDDDQINNLVLAILQVIYNNPGVKVPTIQDKLLSDYPSVILDQIRNSINRKISKYMEYQGSGKLEDIILRIIKRLLCYRFDTIRKYIQY